MATLLDIVKKDSTNRSVTIRIVDSSDGTPETGVVWNTSGIDLWYRRESEAVTSITEATLAALTTAHTDGGFLHISDGEYRLDLPDAAFATGANHVDVGGTVTGMVVIGGRVRLVDYDPEDAVNLGLTGISSLSASTVLLNNPIAADQSLTIVRGVDYVAAHSTNITQTVTGLSSGDWSSPTIVFRYIQDDGSVVTAGTSTVSFSGSTATFSLVLTDTETDAMLAGRKGTYKWKGTDDNSLKLMIAHGDLKVKDPVAE